MTQVEETTDTIEGLDFEPPCVMAERHPNDLPPADFILFGSKRPCGHAGKRQSLLMCKRCLDYHLGIMVHCHCGVVYPFKDTLYRIEPLR